MSIRHLLGHFKFLKDYLEMAFHSVHRAVLVNL